METKVITSKKFTLQLRDFLRGGLMAVGTAVFFVIQQSLEAGKLEFDWKQIGMAAAGAAVMYLSKNLLIEPAKVITTTTNAKIEKVEDKINQTI